MNNKGVSAVIGVIFMVAITVAIASTVFVYVSYMLENNPEFKEDSFEVNGTLKYCNDEKIIIDNQTFNNIRYIDYNMTRCYMGQNITVTFEYKYNNILYFKDIIINTEV